ncbi:MAG: DNA-3-methyladenine glycosylase 2 family protein [Clostridia bacterium]|nr:DNA-3-methyladenine glycosylase 2 family protein [Clostridia bacterium]
MEIEKQKDKIVIKHKNDFNIEEILNCGQVFSYYKTSEKSYVVISGEKFAKITFSATQTTIVSDYVDYFYNYFDLDRDYLKIKREILRLSPDFSKFFSGGDSIRILNQDPVQTIISFIVSANNNIKRIKNFLTNLSERFGEKLPCGFYSFPSLTKLKKATISDFDELKAGYRGAYLVDTIQKLGTQEFDTQNLKKMTTKDLKNKLISLRGIGSKVADCILLFSFQRSDVFPVDTWIRKSFSLFSDEQKNDRQIEQYFLGIFKEYSGYAQQYLYNFMLNKTAL